MKKSLEAILGGLARIVLALHKPRIIGVTGSVGKSTTKDAIACVLKSKFHVRPSPGNLNSQIGLPLAVLGFDQPGGFRKDLVTFAEWALIVLKALGKIFQSDYPKILVLEMGSDRPGDIANLLKLVGHLDGAVITDIGISHMEFFKNQEELTAEKLSLLKGLDSHGFAVLNFDNEIIAKRAKTTASIISYGRGGDCLLRASDDQIISHEEEYGINFKMHYQGTVVPFFIPNALGAPVIYAALAAAAVGLQFGFNLVEISESLKNFAPPAGRLRLLGGIKRTRIIDDTYNAAPSSTAAALDVLKQVAAGRKLAAIGGMAELGKLSEEGHRIVGRKIAEINCDEVFLVGEKSRFIEDELRNIGFKNPVHWFADSDSARMPIQSELQENDTILVKGSQSARMEKIVKEIMSEPLLAETLLVRQSSKWLD